MGWMLYLVQRGGPGRAAAPPSPPLRQGPVYQLNIIRCGTVITFAL